MGGEEEKEANDENDNDDDKGTIDKVEQLLKILPKSYDIEKVRKTFQINITPSGVVLMQELERFNQLVLVVERDLIDLRNVSKNRSKQFNVIVNWWRLLRPFSFSLCFYRHPLTPKRPLPWASN